MAIRLGNKKFGIGNNKVIIYNDDSGRYAVDNLQNFRQRNGSFKDYRGNLVKGPQFLGRVDYETGEGAILSEHSFTNVQSYSEELTGGAYTHNDMTVTREELAGPDKHSVMPTYKLLNTASTARFTRNYGTSGNRQINNSLFVKEGNVKYVGYQMVTNLGTSYVIYNVNAGVISATNEATSDVKLKAKIIAYKDGWYRISVAYKEIATSGTNRFDFLVLNHPTDITSIAKQKYTYATGYQRTQTECLNSYLPTYENQKSSFESRYKRENNMKYWLPNNTNNSQYGITFTARVSILEFNETFSGFISIANTSGNSDGSGTGRYITLEHTLKTTDPIVRFRTKTNSSSQQYSPNLLPSSANINNVIETAYHFGVSYTGADTWIFSCNGSTVALGGFISPSIDTNMNFDTFALAQPSGNKHGWNGRVYSVNILDKPSSQTELNALTAQNI